MSATAFVAVQTVNSNASSTEFYELLVDDAGGGDVYFHTPTGDVLRQHPDGTHTVEHVDVAQLGPWERARIDGNLASWRPAAGKAFVRLVVRR